MARIKVIDCEYCTEPIKVGDHTHCLIRLHTNKIDVIGRNGQPTGRQVYPPEVKACIRALERLGRRALKRPVKVCPTCDTPHQKKGAFCSLVHSAAMNRWLKAGKAKHNKDGSYEIDADARNRLRSTPGGGSK